MTNKFLLAPIGLFFSLTITAQQAEDFLKTRLHDGYPGEIEPLIVQMNLINVSHSTLKTGIDTLDVKFGELTQNETNGYWISLFGSKKLLFWTTVKLFFDEKSGFLSNTVEFDFDNSSKRISVRIKHDPATDEVFYQWIDQNGGGSVAFIETVERPIQENKLMPYFVVKTLDGADISLYDYKGKYLVLNWWATTCGPCIAEMPGLNELVEKYKSRDDVEFVAIAWDEKEKVERFLNKMDFKYQQTLGNEEIVPIFEESFPKHIIVSPDGLVIYYNEGGSVEMHQYIDRRLDTEFNK